MNVYCAENSHEKLKLLIVGDLTGFELLFKEPRGKDAIFHSNFLFEHENGFKLITPNAATKYLSSCKDGTVSLAVDEILEWHASVLQPHLVAFIVETYSKAKVQDIPDNLTQCFKYLNEEIGEHKFLIQDKLSVADVILWVDLFPLLGNKNLPQEKFSTFPNIQSWFHGLSNHKAFKKAVDTLCGEKGFGKLMDNLKGLHVPSSKAENRTKEVTTDKTTEVEEEKISEEEIQCAISAWDKGVENASKPNVREHPILPKPGERNILITSALPYVNNVPHLGNIIGCVLSADVYSRFCRLRNYNSIYICGTDEYGTATETKALEEGLTPQQICDKYHKIHSEIYEWFQIDFDTFGRTTTEKQTEIAQDIFWKLHKNNYLLKDTVEQLLCEKCNRFLADRFVNGTCPFCSYDDARGDQCDKCGKLINATELKDPRCKVCKTAPVIKTSEHLFLDLPQLEGKFNTWLNNAIDNHNWTNSARVIAKSWAKEGLKPRCITRDLKWGTPVPMDGFKEKVFYVWFDAPIGYLSITAKYTKEWEKWWKNPEKVELYQFMAKDNVPFHSVIFPATQIGTNDNYTVVNNLIATEYLNYEDGKFSKSRGVGVFGTDAKETGIPADIWRFYLLFIRPENQDSAFGWSDLLTKNNSELLNNLGNFINRSLSFLSNNFNGVIPEMKLSKEDHLVLVRITRDLTDYINCLEKVKEKDAIKLILNVSRLGNQIMQGAKPWELVKGSPEEKIRGGTVIGLCCNIACLLSVMLQPYMPTVSATIQTQLNAPKQCNVLVPQFLQFLPQGHKIGKPSPLFKKIEQLQMDELKKKFAGQSSQKQEETVKAAGGDIEKIQNAIIEQGNKVRDLKLNKAEKFLIDEEVKALLTLKKQLVDAGGEVQPPKSSSKSKKKKK